MTTTLEPPGSEGPFDHPDAPLGGDSRGAGFGAPAEAPSRVPGAVFPAAGTDSRPHEQPEKWPETPPGRGGRVSARRLAAWAVAGIMLAAGIAYVATWYVHSLHYESTDDAFIDGHVVSVAPRISGYVTQVYVEDNQEVKKGDVLVRLDGRDLEAKAAEARAALQMAEAQERGAETNVDLVGRTSQAARDGASTGVVAAQAMVALAEAHLGTSQSQMEQAEAQTSAERAALARDEGDLARLVPLAASSGATQQELEHARATVEVDKARVNAAEKAVAAAQTDVILARAGVDETQAKVVAAREQLAEADVVAQRVDGAKAQVAQAVADVAQRQAAVRAAELALSYTTISAEAAGRVTRKAVEAGNYVTAAQPLLALVSKEVWVVANFKETQLGKMKPGDAVEFRVDAYPGRVFHGRVDSIQAGTGAAFSLLPPENASGNYIKVVQRVPVKIIPDPSDPGSELLGPGMSVVPEVKVE